MHYRSAGAENTANLVGTLYEFEDNQDGSTTPLVSKINMHGGVIEYRYDDCGRITEIIDGGTSITYQYDVIGQLIRANDPTDGTAGSGGTTWIYTYDLGGNILTKTAYPYTTGTVGTAAENHTYTYGNAGWKDQLTARDGVEIQYDSIGNPTNDGTWTYTWQHGKQLAQMNRIGGNETISFEYNEDGLRTKKTSSSTGVTEYTLHGKNIVHMKNGTNEMHFFYDAQDKPAIVVFNGSSYRYMYTLQGDVYGLTDENNSWVVFYRYDAWGKPLGIGGSMANTLGVLQPFRYRGYVFDEETGLYYLRSRYYRAAWCRFVNADVLYGENLYVYCHNNPQNRSDPYGYFDTVENDDSVFHDSVTSDMRRFLRNREDYFYKIGNRNQAWKKKRGREPGWIDCVYLLSEKFKGPSTSSGRYNTPDYFDKKGEIGDLVDRIMSGEPIENFVYIEVFQWDGTYNAKGEMSMEHCGAIVIHNFGDGNVLAVYQSASDSIGYCDALFADDTGPNITALFDNCGGTGRWTHYGIKNDERHTYHGQ